MMDKPTTLTFFINPVAGNGTWKRTKRKLDFFCRHHQIDPEYFFTGESQKIKILLEEKERLHVPFVFAVGGDGTVNELARYMIGMNMALGIIPMGSGNGLARHLRISTRIHQALKLVMHHEMVDMDYALINDNPFFTTSGVGFDAEISNVYSICHQRRFIGYVKAFIKVIPSFKPLSVTLNHTGEAQTHRAFILAFANASQYGNSAYIAPNACITDGKIDMVMIHTFSWINIPFLVMRMFTKTLHKSRFVRTLRCSKVIAEQNMRGSLHFDGEVGTHEGKIVVKMGKGKLRVLVPPQFRKNIDTLKPEEVSIS